MARLPSDHDGSRRVGRHGHVAPRISTRPQSAQSLIPTARATSPARARSRAAEPGRPGVGFGTGGLSDPTGVTATSPVATSDLRLPSVGRGACSTGRLGGEAGPLGSSDGEGKPNGPYDLLSVIPRSQR
jgi:hypothetical protein